MSHPGNDNLMDSIRDHIEEGHLDDIEFVRGQLDAERTARQALEVSILKLDAAHKRTIERLEKALGEAFASAEKIFEESKKYEIDPHDIADLASEANLALNPDFFGGCSGCHHILRELNSYEICEECMEHQFS